MLKSSFVARLIVAVLAMMLFGACGTGDKEQHEPFDSLATEKTAFEEAVHPFDYLMSLGYEDEPGDSEFNRAIQLSDEYEGAASQYLSKLDAVEVPDECARDATRLRYILSLEIEVVQGLRALAEAELADDPEFVEANQEQYSTTSEALWSAWAEAHESGNASSCGFKLFGVENGEPTPSARP